MVDDSKSLFLLLIILIILVRVIIKVEVRDNVDLWENDSFQSYLDVLDIFISSLDKVSFIFKFNVYSFGDMYNYCINYVNFELFVEFFNFFEFFN